MQTIAVVINNKARNCSTANTYLEGFDKAEIPYELYETTAENLEATAKNCIKKHSVILIGGGDGSVRTVAHHCAHTSAILGVLPLGTLNHFAKEMGLPLTVEDVIKALQQQHTTQIDLAMVNDHIFINNSSIGFYPKFADKRDHYSKYYNKWISYIPGFIESLKKHRSFRLTIKSKKLNLPLRTSFLMVSNNLYSYEFPATIKRESFQKALLGLYFFKQGKIRLLKLIKRLFSNKNLFEVEQSLEPIEIHFENDDEVNVSLDGETTKMKTPLQYQSLPGALTLLTNPS